jgi:UDP-glucose 4-epimerase
MILVTGGCGYIGSHLVKALTERGERVVVFDNLASGRREALLHHEELVVGDITDRSALKQVFANYPVDLIIHLAALVNAAESVAKRHKYLHVNGDGARMVWETAAEAGVKHFLFASSAAVYGNPGTQDAVIESFPLKPTNPYGESKVMGEESLRAVAESAGATYGIFRFFNVAGAEKEGILYQNPDNRAILTRLFAAAAGLTPSVTVSGNDHPTVDGTVVRDFIHVEDIVAAHLLAIDHLGLGKSSFTINLGTGRPTSIKELVKVVELVTGTKLNIIYGPKITGDISYSLAAAQKAKETLSWQAQKSIQQIVEDAWRAYRAHV